MRVCDYLDAKYGGRGTTILACEAKALGIPYPPPSGWLTTHGLKEITSDAAERLGEALRKSTKDTAEGVAGPARCVADAQARAGRHGS